jgi:bacterioferritin-associated ferredoxin
MLTGILSAAVLFMLFGLLRPRAGCGGNCGMCRNACDEEQGKHRAD